MDESDSVFDSLPQPSHKIGRTYTMSVKTRILLGVLSISLCLFVFGGVVEYVHYMRCEPNVISYIRGESTTGNELQRHEELESQLKKRNGKLRRRLRRAYDACEKLDRELSELKIRMDEQVRNLERRGKKKATRQAPPSSE